MAFSCNVHIGGQAKSRALKLPIKLTVRKCMRLWWEILFSD